MSNSDDLLIKWVYPLRAREEGRRKNGKLMPPTSAAPQCTRFLAISDLCQDHLAVLADLFHQVLELCRQAGLVKLGHVVLDNTIVRANAARHRAIHYARMKGRKAQLAAGTSGG